MDLVLIILFLSSIFCITVIFIEKRILGARYICSFFFLIFMILAPINERINNIVYYNGAGVSDESYYYASLVVFLFSFFLFFSSIVFKSKNFNFTNLQTNTSLIYLFPWIGGIIYLLLIGGDLGFLFIREPDVDYSISQQRYLFADRFLRLTIAISAFLVMTLSNNKIKKIIAISGLIIFCFPTALPRFMIAIVYIPFLMLILNFFLKKKFLLKIKKTIINLLLIFFIPLGFVLFNYYRNPLYLKNFTLDLNYNISNFLNAGHLDSFQSFQNAIDHVEITWGKQLLSAIFFFIPRQFWHNKSTGTGGLIAESSDYEWFNVSANYFAEGYVNFGFFGVIVFGFVLLYCLTSIDRIKKFNISNLIIYFFIPGTIFILLRGDMMNAFTVILPIFLLCFVFKIILNKNYKV